MKENPRMEPKTLGLLALLCLLLDSPSVLGDVILNKDGKVVKVGKNAVVVGVKVQIQDCETGKVYEYDSHEYQARPGDDCKVKRPAAPSPPAPNPPAGNGLQE
jgi:hypothetical protein